MPFQGLPWTEFISCPVCSKVFNEQQQRPISLGCGHTVCKSCIRSKLNDNRCPFDQTSLPSEVDKLPANFALMHLVGAAVPEQEKKATFTVSDNPKSYEQARKCIEEMAEHLKPLADSNSDDDSSTCSDPGPSNDRNDAASTNKVHTTNSSITPRCVLSRPMQRKLISLIHCQLLEEEGRSRSARIARSLGDRVVSECLTLHQYPHQLSANLWAAVRTRGCQFLGPAMQEEVLKLILMALEDGSFLSRKNLVLFVVQRMEERYPQASKTAIGHVVQLLYRASCFKVLKREEKSSLMQLKEEFRQYDLLCREHDTQMLQIASEAGLRISPEQWSSLLYGDSSHKSHMQSIIDKHQTPQSFAQSISELMSTLQKSGDPCCLRKLQPQLEFLSNIDPSPDCPAPSWENLEAIMRSLNTVMTAFVEFLSSPDYRSRQEVAPTQNVRYKTSMCRDFSAQGTCPRGNTCTFAHSQEELERYRSRSRRAGSNVDVGYADKKSSRLGAVKDTQVQQVSLLSNKESRPKPGAVTPTNKEGAVEPAKGSGSPSSAGNGSIPLSLSGSSCVSSALALWCPRLDAPSDPSGGRAPLKQRPAMNRMSLAGPARPAVRSVTPEQPPAFVHARVPHPSMQLTFSSNSQAVDALDDGHHPSKAHLMKFYPSASVPLLQGSLQQNHVSNSPHFPRSNPCGTATGFPAPPPQCGVSSPQAASHPSPFYPPPGQNSAHHNFDDWTSRLQHVPPPVLYPVTKRDEIPPATGGAAVGGCGLYPHGAPVYPMQQAEETLEDLTSRKLELISHLQEPMFMHPMTSACEASSASSLMQPLDGLKTVLADNKHSRWGMPKHVSDMFVATRSTQSLDDLIQDDLPRYLTPWSTGEDLQAPDGDKSKARISLSDACLNFTSANIPSNHACSDILGSSTVSGSLLYNFPSSHAVDDAPRMVDVSSLGDPEFSRFPGDDGDDLFIPFEHSSVSRFGPISRMAKAKVDNIAPVQVTADSSKKLTPALAVTPLERPVTGSMLMSGSGDLLSAEPAVKPTPTEAPSIWQHSPQPSHHNIAWLKAGAAEAFTNNERLAYELQAVELEISMKTGRKPKPVGKIISEAVMGMCGPQASVGAPLGYSSPGTRATCTSGQVSRTYEGSALGHGHVTECLTNIIPSHRAAQKVLEHYERSWLGMKK